MTARGACEGHTAKVAKKKLAGALSGAIGGRCASRRRSVGSMATEQPLPKNRAGEPERHTPFEIHQNHEYFQREYLIAVAEIKLMQASALPAAGAFACCPVDALISINPTRSASQQELRECFYKNGINQFEECKEIREKLWKKIHTPNYGAPGPSRSVRRHPWAQPGGAACFVSRLLLLSPCANRARGLPRSRPGHSEGIEQTAHARLPPRHSAPTSLHRQHKLTRASPCPPPAASIRAHASCESTRRWPGGCSSCHRQDPVRIDIPYTPISCTHSLHAGTSAELACAVCVYMSKRSASRRHAAEQACCAKGCGSAARIGTMHKLRAWISPESGG
jgi:hypothetical protein